MNQTRLILIVILTTANAFAQVSNKCNTLLGQGCVEVKRPISEVPSGQIDGRNTSYVLSTDPDSTSPIRLFRNGIELNAGGDYQTSGRNLTLLPSRAPIAGDVLNAFYFERAGSQGRETGLSRQKGAQHPVYDTEVAAQLLSCALNSEASQAPPTPAVNQPADIGIRGASGGLVPPRERKSSLRMMFSRLGESSSTVRHAAQHSQKNSYGSQGIEGIGDEAVPSAFDILDATVTPPTPASRETSATQTNTKQSNETARQPSSLRMLAAKLRQTEGLVP